MVPTIIVIIINLISPFKNLLNMFIPPFHNRTCTNRVYKKEEARVGLQLLNYLDSNVSILNNKVSNFLLISSISSACLIVNSP